MSSIHQHCELTSSVGGCSFWFLPQISCTSPLNWPLLFTLDAECWFFTHISYPKGGYSPIFYAAFLVALTKLGQLVGVHLWTFTAHTVQCSFREAAFFFCEMILVCKAINLHCWINLSWAHWQGCPFSSEWEQLQQWAACKQSVVILLAAIYCPGLFVQI